MKNSKYNAQYFLDFFKSIPRGNWITGHYFGSDPSCGCAVGHIRRITSWDGSRMERVAKDLAFPAGGLIPINDGKCSSFKQTTIKGRVVAVFRQLVKQGK